MPIKVYADKIETTEVTVDNESNSFLIPDVMQPDTILIYDDDLNYSFEQGGDVNMKNQKPSEIYASPGMKAVYDKNGILKNVYYPVPGEPGSYQLSDPASAYLNTDIRNPGSGKHPYDGGKCVLDFKETKVVGTGQITFYGQPDDGKKVFVGLPLIM